MRFRGYVLLFVLSICYSCGSPKKELDKNHLNVPVAEVTSLIILGTVQDAGSPHPGCTKDCCVDLFMNPDFTRKRVALGVVDTENSKSLLFEATPDISDQLFLLGKFAGKAGRYIPDGIILTHAHIGHYTGLMYLGKEGMNTQNVPVYAMPRMTEFLTDNGPWDQLVTNGNVEIQVLSEGTPLQFTNNLSVEPILVPHRDEYSESVGFIISGPRKKVLFIPDIDKWERWELKITEVIAKVDYALIDATFFDSAEVNNRSMDEIPHPFVVESMELLGKISESERKKIYFIHFNHTNPLLDIDSQQAAEVKLNGFNIAKMFDVFEL